MTAATADERLARVGLLRRLLIRPELGAVVGAVVVFTFFATQSAVFRSPDGHRELARPGRHARHHGGRRSRC